jgi:hypothetical protein
MPSQRAGQKAAPTKESGGRHRDISGRELGLVGLLGVFGAALLLGTAFFLKDVDWIKYSTSPSLLLPLLLIIGVMLLITSLAAYAIVLHGLQLSGAGVHALGLPEGSVRAVLALALLLVFAIMSVFLFIQLQHPSGRVSTGLTAEQVGLFAPGQVLSIDPEASTSPQTFTVSVATADPAASQVAQQLVTVLATLVTAVAAFYFGASSVKEAGATAVKLYTSTAGTGDKGDTEGKADSGVKTDTGGDQGKADSGVKTDTGG